MAWDIRDDGFAITLSSYVPDLLAGDLRERIAGTLAARGLQPGQVDEWAVHPGGRAILDRVEDSLGLERNGLHASRNVLRDYGNMSSATLLFVLKELLDEAESAPAVTCAMAFGPGLTLETAVLERLGCTVPQAPRPAVRLRPQPLHAS
jgi:predicted naringenin-chalcone synthase